ncbi:MAG: hypothetical protein HGB06_03510 [Chlorobaculum sp.]|jgi:hypothetical protein|nr:hypothetical protein [Chlorobaculum sp.]
MSENECKVDAQKKISTTGTKFATGAAVTAGAAAGTISSAVGAAALGASIAGPVGLIAGAAIVGGLALFYKLDKEK